MNSPDALWILIPTADRTLYIPNIVKTSGVDKSKIVLVRTIPSVPIPGLTNIYYDGEFNIHAWWNFGLDYIAKNGGRYVAVLNDDAKLNIGDLSRLHSQMLCENSILAIPVKRGQAGWGHCWILDLSYNLRPDERFKWWCGEHDLEIRANRHGDVTYLDLGIINLHANELTVEDAQLQELVRKDIRCFRRRYPLRAVREFVSLIIKRL